MELLMKPKLATTVTAAKGRAWHVVSTVSFVIILLLNREQYASGLDLTDFKCENFGSCPEPQNADNLWDCMLKNVLNGDISNAFKKLGHRELINKLTASDAPVNVIRNNTPSYSGGYFPDYEAYTLASRRSHNRNYPYMVYMAESVEEIQKSLQCAVESGFQVAPRGRGHSYQAYSSMSGYVVIDTTELCAHAQNVDDWEPIYSEEPHILPGQKSLGTLKVGPGCTNAVWLAASQEAFPQEKGPIAVIGTCPSVGVVGFALGGGSGDATPWVGYGADAVEEFEVIPLDESNYGSYEPIKANATHNSDLYWALQGGGMGFGFVTSMRVKVIEGPKPLDGGSDRKFCFIDLNFVYDHTNSSQFVKAFRGFLYDSDPEESARFGGGGVIDGWGQLSGGSFQKFNLYGLYLGSAKEFVQVFDKYGLLDFLIPGDAVVYQDYEQICDGAGTGGPCVVDGVPIQYSDVTLAEFGTYGEAMASRLCENPLASGWQAPLFNTYSTGDICSDLGVAEENCEIAILEYMETPVRILKKDRCFDSRLLIETILEKSADPKSFINSGGYSPEAHDILHEMDEKFGILSQGFPYWSLMPQRGGFFVPDVDMDTWEFIVNSLSFIIYHFQHGASLTISPNKTGFFHRGGAIMANAQAVFDNPIINRLIEYFGSPSKFQGYVNYLWPAGNPDFGLLYHGDNYDRLTEIKRKFDPLDFFGNPQTVPPSSQERVCQPIDGQTGSATSGSAFLSPIPSFVLVHLLLLLLFTLSF